MINFFVFGDPVPQGRPRFTTKPFPMAYDPKTSKDWKKVVATHARCSKPDILEGPLHMSLSFYLKRPKSLPKKVKHHIKKPDLDNLAKAVKDALEGICFLRDQQVVSMDLKKEYATEGVTGATGVRVTIRKIEA